MARPLSLLFTATFLLLFASSAQALTVGFGEEDESLHGASGELTINGPIDEGRGTFDVVWSMDFDGYDGSVGDHPYLTNIAFKGFHEMSSVTLDEIVWSVPVSGELFYPSNVSNGGCAMDGPGAEAGMVCVELDRQVDATQGGEIFAHFTVTGELDTSEWSYRGKFGEDNGWVISESGVPIPEPTAAMLFAAGLLVTRWRARRA